MGSDGAHQCRSIRMHSVLQGSNPPWKMDPPNRENLPFVTLKLVEIPITTVFFLIKTWLTNLLTHSLTLTRSLTGQVDLSIVKQTDVKSHQLILEIYQMVYLLYLWNYINSHISAKLYKSLVILKPKAATGSYSEKKVFWNLWSKPLKNTCEEVHFLVKLQALDLQLKWSPSKVYFSVYWLLFRIPIF